MDAAVVEELFRGAGAATVQGETAGYQVFGIVKQGEWVEWADRVTQKPPRTDYPPTMGSACAVVEYCSTT